MYKRNKNDNRTLEKIIEDLYKEKDDYTLYGNYNIGQIYYKKGKDLKNKFKNSIVEQFI